MARHTHKSGSSLAERLTEAVNRRDFLLMVLSRSLSQNTASHKVTVRPVELRGESQFQWITRSGPQERHENLTADELIERTSRAFGTAFGDVHLYTKTGDFTGKSHGGGQVKWKSKPPSKADQPPTAHNREKNYLIPAGQPCPFLSEIGVMTATGQVKATMSAKFRQINRYLEFLEDILPVLPTDEPIRIVDFGCGKSYLTFAMHHLFTVIHQRQVQILGFDLKEDVITHCQQVATKLNCKGLEFRAGDIAHCRPEGPVHLAISLHACDTATDEAIAAAIRWGCRAILAVPCCQHEVHHLLRADSVPGLTDFGLIRERFAALATDALRAEYLEAAGYKTQVLEFIDMEHTPKNLLIRAVKRTEPDQAARTAAMKKLEDLKSLLGISTWRLEQAKHE